MTHSELPPQPPDMRQINLQDRPAAQRAWLTAQDYELDGTVDIDKVWEQARTKRKNALKRQREREKHAASDARRARLCRAALPGEASPSSDRR